MLDEWGCCTIFAGMQSNNVGLTTVTVCATKCVTIISVLICEQMEIPDIGADGTHTHAHTEMNGTHGPSNRFRGIWEQTVSYNFLMLIGY